MKFAVSNDYAFGLGGNVNGSSSKGLGLLDKIFGKKSEDKSKVEQLDDAKAAAEFEVNGKIELSLDIDVDEFKQLREFYGESNEIEKKNLSFIYNGAKKFCNDLIVAIETKGKTLVNNCWDVADEFDRRDHQSDIQRIKDSAELDKVRKESRESEKD